MKERYRIKQSYLLITVREGDFNKNSTFEQQAHEWVPKLKQSYFSWKHEGVVEEKGKELEKHSQEHIGKQFHQS